VSYAPQHAAPPQATPGGSKATVALVLGCLSILFSILTGIPAVILGMLALGDIREGRADPGGRGMAKAGIIVGIIGSVVSAILGWLLWTAVSRAADAAVSSRDRAISLNNLRQIGVALANHEAHYRCLPAAGENERGERPRLSWRVQLLREIDQYSLYEQFHHDEPWDSPHNKSLIDKMPAVFKPPGYDLPPGHTCYLAVTGPKTAFPGPMLGTMDSRRPRGVRDSYIIDGRTNTITVVEADEDQAVPWTKPDDWEYDSKQPTRGLGNSRRGGFLALFADGSIQTISRDADPEAIRAAMTARGGENLDREALTQSR